MSADNWAICPQCRIERETKSLKLKAAAAQAYGQVSAEEWKRLDDEAHARQEERTTLREDYELGVDSHGMFKVVFNAFCDKCKFSYSFKHSADATKVQS
jgi:hypothetical protein